jgi:RNA polymerase primary sigma factor
LGEFIQNDIVEESHYNVTDKVKTTLNDLLSELPIRESDIIKAYFGLDSDCEPMTLEAIGDKFQLTKERVRQIKNKTLRKLKHNSNELFMVLNE